MSDDGKDKFDDEKCEVIIEEVVKYTKEDLKIMHDCIGLAKVSLNDPMMEKLVLLRKKIIKDFESRSNP